MDDARTLAYACVYAEDESGGIVSLRFDPDTGQLRRLYRTPVKGASFLAIHPDRTHLYVVTRGDGGFLRAYRREESGRLTEISTRPSGGSGPCYVSVDAAGSHAFVSNYPDSTIAAYPILENGELGETSQIIEFEGSSVHPERQREPHPHSIDLCPNDRFVYVPDLGTDRVMSYRLDRNSDSLQPTRTPYVSVGPGAGPRHFEFHPNGTVCYLINELDSTITSFDYDSETGALSEIETASTLPESFVGENACADVHVHPTGRWVYGSNRGHDSIAIFETDETGRLHSVGHEPTGGHWPRGFALDPTGGFLYAENRRSDSVVIFAVDEQTGGLSPTGDRLELPEPVCLRFVTPEPGCR